MYLIIFHFSLAEGEHFITIPSFVMRGAGKQTHYEYEVRIALPDGKLNILRRYSRFRELHLCMKHCYGAKVRNPVNEKFFHLTNL